MSALQGRIIANLLEQLAKLEQQGKEDLRIALGTGSAIKVLQTQSQVCVQFHHWHPILV
jgi:hypothetical protein